MRFNKTMLIKKYKFNNNKTLLDNINGKADIVRLKTIFKMTIDYKIERQKKYIFSRHKNVFFL